MCVLYRGRLVVPTVLRKATRRVPQQDLESLVPESNGRIDLHSDASLRKNVDGERGRRDSNPASSKIASEANLSRARGIRELGRKKDCLQNKRRIADDD